jgi:hypothetical protein
MTPSNSPEGHRALSRLFQKKSVAIALSMKTGDGETETATINVPEEALLADCFHNRLDTT